MVHKQHIFGEYVFTPCQNAFNNKTSYWVSKDGYMLSTYAFTPIGEKDLKDQLKNKDTYIQIFDTMVQRLSTASAM